MDSLKIERTVDGRHNEIQVQQQVTNGQLERIVTHKEVIPNGNVVNDNGNTVVVNSNPVRPAAVGVTPVEQLVTLTQADECVTRSDVEDLLRKYVVQRPVVNPDTVSRADLEAALAKIQPKAPPVPAPAPVPTNNVTKGELESLIQNYLNGGNTSAPAAPKLNWLSSDKLNSVVSYVLITALAVEVGWLVWSQFIR